METHEIDIALEKAESALLAGRSMEGTGFWRAVGKARKDPEIARAYASRIGAIDRLAFMNGVRIKVPLAIGNLLLIAGSLLGIGATGAASMFDPPIRDLLFLLGFGALLVCTHSLTHYLFGRAFGIRFTHYFLGGPPPPRPGIKSDYSSYLLVDPKKRAVMHASGAVVTKALPFLAIPIAMTVGVSSWMIAVLVALGITQIITDVLFSTKTSDWKKALREWRLG